VPEHFLIAEPGYLRHDEARGHPRTWRLREKLSALVAGSTGWREKHEVQPLVTRGFGDGAVKGSSYERVANYLNGLSSRAPVDAKCPVFRVTTLRS